jgi:hypothetical protein
VTFHCSEGTYFTLVMWNNKHHGFQSDMGVLQQSFSQYFRHAPYTLTRVQGTAVPEMFWLFCTRLLQSAGVVYHYLIVDVLWYLCLSNLPLLCGFVFLSELVIHTLLLKGWTSLQLPTVHHKLNVCISIEVSSREMLNWLAYEEWCLPGCYVMSLL